MCFFEKENLNLDDICTIGRLPFLCNGPSKGRSLAQQVPPLEGFVKFNVEGAAKGKPGTGGNSGSLEICEGEVLMMLCKNIGIKDSNKVGVLAILVASWLIFHFQFNEVVIV